MGAFIEPKIQSRTEHYIGTGVGTQLSKKFELDYIPNSGTVDHPSS